jgi:enediyne biosynthesis protein E4
MPSFLTAMRSFVVLGAALAPLFAAAAPWFTDATAASGVAFVHGHGGSGQKYFCETMGSGVVVADFDGDGHLDLYFVNGAALPGFPGYPQKFPNRMYRGRGDGTFEDVTERSGTAGSGYGMGASAADYDGDGDLDLYVTNFGPNILYRNNGDGTFTDVTAAAGVGDPRWSTSSAWADMDGDGDLDLYVANYVDFDLEHNKFCGKVAENIRAYCHPDAYPGVSNRLYRNNGDGTFTDVTAAAGVENPATKGLGVLWLDVDNDGHEDLYSADDSTVNLLFRNRGDGTFEDATLLSGAGYNEAGATEAGMGVDAADLNGDPYPDIVVTNLDLEGITLYLGTGPGTFTDAGFRVGVKAPSLPFVGFGVSFLDFDNDGDLDLAVTNGHIIDNIELFRPGSTYAQPLHLYENDGTGRFRQLPAADVLAGAPVRVGRGLAVGDFNEDGKLDLVLSNNNGPAQVLLNAGPSSGHWLGVRLRGKRNRFGVGARVTVTAGGRQQWREVRAGSSYCSQSAIELHFGLGAVQRVEKLEVRWPSGAVQTLSDVAADQRLVLDEP